MQETQQMKNEEEKEDEFESELLNFNEPDFKFIPNERHEWRQQGPYLVCKQCQLEHAAYIGMEKLLVGIDDNGQPIFIDR